MNNTAHFHRTKLLRVALIAAGLLAGTSSLAACGGSSVPTPTSLPGSMSSISTATTQVGGPVLPIVNNPINNTATVQSLKIDSVLVENNVDSSGKIVDDHLEIALTNTGTSELTAFEIFYTFTDLTTNVTENYYAKLSSGFTIPAGGKRTAHFDNTGQPDHFPVNEFSLYYIDKNALEVTVMVSASNSATQTTSLKKDAGGPEAAD